MQIFLYFCIPFLFLFVLGWDILFHLYWDSQVHKLYKDSVALPQNLQNAQDIRTSQLPKSLCNRSAHQSVRLNFTTRPGDTTSTNRKRSFNTTIYLNLLDHSTSPTCQDLKKKKKSPLKLLYIKTHHHVQS